jgi:hypothetical protein
MGQYDLAVLKVLNFDEQNHSYLLPTISKATKALHFVEFTGTNGTNTYTSTDGSNLQLIDKQNMKVLRLADGTKYIFVRYPDSEFRCASIQSSKGTALYLLYSANGLLLHGITDSIGRSLTFGYARKGIDSITQTWMANSQGVTKTWSVGDPADRVPASLARFAHAVGISSEKFLPSNALVREYSANMAASDKMLAGLFGGPSAIAGGNGFEPPGLATVYPLYRGDVVGDDGKPRRGHLSYAMHLYGSADGRGDSPLYVPAGFTSHSTEPSPTDASVTFFYPKLGELTNVTLAVFHVADFQITNEGDRVRIGNIGGPGGASPLYKHSHIEFYRGNTGLPAAEARSALRIDPATVFGSR